MLIRPVTQGDAVSLHQRCWPEQPFFDVETRLIDVLARTKRGEAWGVVVDVEGQASAFGQLGRWGRRAEISDLIVAPGLRGRGLGTAIIQHLLACAAENGLPEVEIGAAASNPRALALYRRLGFTEQRRVRLDLGSGLETIIYLSRTP